MAEADTASETDSQLIKNTGLIIVSHTHIFAGRICKCHGKPEAEKT